MMRFGKQDPMGYVDGLNDYQVVGGNPITFVDPDGLQATQPATQPTFHWTDVPFEVGKKQTKVISVQSKHFNHFWANLSLQGLATADGAAINWALGLTESGALEQYLAPDGSEAKFLFKQKLWRVTEVTQAQKQAVEGLDHKPGLVPGDPSQPEWRPGVTGPVTAIPASFLFPSGKNDEWNKALLSWIPVDKDHPSFLLKDSPGLHLPPDARGFANSIWRFTIEAYRECNGTVEAKPFGTWQFAVGLHGVWNTTRNGWDWTAKYDITDF